MVEFQQIFFNYFGYVTWVSWRLKSPALDSCLLNSFLRLITKTLSILRITGLLWWKYTGDRGIPTQSVMLKRFPCYDVNSIWPSDGICRDIYGSTLAQVMACCLTAPSHYLNQCWLIIMGVFCHSAPKSNFTGNAQDIYLWYEFENYQLHSRATSPRGERVNVLIATNCWLNIVGSLRSCSFWM